VANWIVDGDPGYDVFGMDVARFGPYASSERYLLDTTAQFYARRFVMAFPNEELPAARPLKTTPCYDAFQEEGARFTVNWGLEVPLYFAPSPDFEEHFTLGRSNAEMVVAEEVEAVRSAAGAYEIAQYARYEVTGSDAEGWLDHLVSSRIPAVGNIRLAPMLNEAGRLMGDLTVARLDEDRFWLTGSYYLQDWHLRWFHQHLPVTGVDVRNITDSWMGFSISGPESRRILERFTDEDVSNEGFGFLTCRVMDVGTARAVVGRISLTGELGYEITVPTEQHRTLLHEMREAGSASDLQLIGDRAVDSLRMEKSYGIWSTEFTQAYTPGMSGLDRYVAFDKGDFIGSDAVRRERETGAPELLVLLEVDAEDADASGDEGVWLEGRRVGFVTSGSYGHHVRKSLALAYVDREIVDARPVLTVHVVGDERTARILPEPPYDPKGSKLRDTPVSTSP
jgi:dimethylglycine dehydrogenase